MIHEEINALQKKLICTKKRIFSVTDFARFLLKKCEFHEVVLSSLPIKHLQTKNYDDP